MSLADDVQKVVEEDDSRPCGTGIWVSNLDERDRTAFDSYLRQGGPVAKLHQIAVVNGCPIGETQFRRHCRQRCGCYTKTGIAA